jgi:hypothetical protein
MVLTGCRKGGTSLTASPEVPAARGEVRIGEDGNQNVRLDLRVEHLAEPSRLTPPRQAYVVWILPLGAPAVRQGQLVVNDDLEGRIEMTTPHRTFELLVTAEQSAAPDRPGDQVIFRTTINRRTW